LETSDRHDFSSWKQQHRIGEAIPTASFSPPEDSQLGSESLDDVCNYVLLFAQNIVDEIVVAWEFSGTPSVCGHFCALLSELLKWERIRGDNHDDFVSGAKFTVGLTDNCGRQRRIWTG
jgi:hypothetical protein